MFQNIFNLYDREKSIFYFFLLFFIVLWSGNLCIIRIMNYLYVCCIRSDQITGWYLLGNQLNKKLNKILIYKQKTMQQQKLSNIAKIQVETQFSQMFDDIHNSSCFQCGKQSKQWVETRHAIFLCLTCATKFRDISKVTNIKSVSLDCWSQEEMQMIKRGGNWRFKDFLSWYDLQNQRPDVYLRSKAAQFYRIYLLNPSRLQLSDAPSINEGKISQVQQVPITEMTSDQLIHEAKNTLTKAGETTLYYGNMAYDKIQRIAAGEYKQDAKKAAEKVSETAKTILSFIFNKIDQLKQSQNKQNMSPASHIIA